MDVKERLLDFISYKGLNKSRFQRSIGVSGSYIQNIANGIGTDVLRRIEKIYPELNTDWLVSGNGEMLNKTPMQNGVDVLYEVLRKKDMEISALKDEITALKDEIGSLKDEVSRLRGQNEILREQMEMPRKR
ncbi:MAG: hypothetical protein LUC23_01045 [Prevotellaceae bacterium]|nr:hypothetical protein [Prevotellaceae bacterium]